MSRLSGIAVPLGALRTADSPVIGEFSSLESLARWAKKAGIGIIQLLPVLDTGTQSSPYSSLSAFALHPMYISLAQIPAFKNLYKRNKNFAAYYDSFVKQHKDAVRFDYESVNLQKHYLLESLYRAESLSLDGNKEFAAWVKKQDWLPAYCVYKCLKNAYMQSTWKGWGTKDRKITAQEIDRRWKDKSLHDDLYFFAWEQFIAYQQFAQAADAVRKAGIILKGDLPILMNDDSCDAWCHPELFNQKLRAGSPPDGSNPTGQNWGFPTYNWKKHAADGFAWWKLRLKTASQFYDAYRLDHILGFFRIWAVPEGENTAELGHTEPYATLSRKDLEDAGFDKGRIRWLSEPHLNTERLDPFVQSREEAHAIFRKFCTQIGNEELWLFKDDIQTARDVYAVDLHAFGSDAKANQIKDFFCRRLKNRTLIELSSDKYVPSWLYQGTKAWQSLNDDEKNRLHAIFAKVNDKNEKLWQKQAEEIFDALIPYTKMIPCGEDLGAHLACLSPTMEKYGILHLNVVRWTRDWGADGQPYIPFENYCPLDVTTTSVHDSTTIRQWWSEERESARAFEKAFAPKPKAKKAAATTAKEKPMLADEDFSPKAAAFVLEKSAQTAGAWFINPLQDWLSLDKKYWQKDEQNERVNIPGSVSPFNWTYRMSVPIETLAKDEKITTKIREIAHAHDKEKSR